MVFALAGDSTITSGLGNEAPHGFKAGWMKAGWSKAGWIEGGDSAGQSASRHERAAESSGIGVRKCRHGGWRPVKRDRRDDHPRTPGDKVYSALVLAFLGLPDPKEIIESMSPFGEIAVILIVFAETGLLIGFFLPGDSLLFTAGLLAHEGNLNIWFLLIGVFVAAVVGDQVGYQFGKKAGPSIFRKPDARLFRQEYVQHTKDFFDKHGPKTVVLARFVPVVRTFAPVLAGVGEMNRRTFTIYNVVGALVWAVGVTLLGYALGSAIGEDNVDKYLYPIIAVIILVSFIPPFLEWRKHRKAKTEEEAVEEAEELHELLDGE
jgi:membrane-associated protein